MLVSPCFLALVFFSFFYFPSFVTAGQRRPVDARSIRTIFRSLCRSISPPLHPFRLTGTCHGSSWCFSADLRATLTIRVVEHRPSRETNEAGKGPHCTCHRVPEHTFRIIAELAKQPGDNHRLRTPTASSLCKRDCPRAACIRLSS